MPLQYAWKINFFCRFAPCFSPFHAGELGQPEPARPRRAPVLKKLCRQTDGFYYSVVGVFIDSFARPGLDCLKIPSFFTLSLSHQFLDACMEH